MKKILVIGSLNMDMVAEVDHTPVAGETILTNKMELVPGGKGANQAYAAGKLGAQVCMLGAVGADSYGKTERENLAEAGVDVSSVLVREEASTGAAFITVNREGDNCIVVVAGANATLSPADIEENEGLIKQNDIIILQLEIPLDTVVWAAKTAKKYGKLVILDPAPVPREFPEELYRYVDIMKPNETELKMLTGFGGSEAELKKAAQFLKDQGVGNVVVTLGGNGVYVEEKSGENHRIPALKVETVDTTAAGDTFTAALALKIAQGAELREAAEYANYVSALVVTRKGAQSSIPSAREVDVFLDYQVINGEKEIKRNVS